MKINSNFTLPIRPYYIGNAKVKNHKVPLAAIPCMAYSQKTDEAENNEEPETEKSAENTSNEITAVDNQENITESSEKTPEKNAVIQKVDAKMVRSDKNLMSSATLREYIEKKFDFEEVEGKVRYPLTPTLSD